MAIRPSFIAASIAFSGWLYGQSDTLTISTAASSTASITVNLTLSSPAGSEPAAVQWTLGYTSGAVWSISEVDGSSATSAGKSISCAADVGIYTCVASGMNSNIITNGVVASITFNLVPGTSTPISFSQADGVDPTGASLTITPMGGSGGGGGGGGGGGSGSSVSSLYCNPTSVVVGGSTICTVSLSSPAPSGGMTVTFGGSEYFSLPPSVTVPSGALSTTFTATALPRTAGSIVVLKVIGGGGTATFTVNITGSSGTSTLSSVGCLPATVAGGDSSACTVALSGPAPAGGAAISASSNNTAVSVPSAVTIAAGATSANFTASTSSVASSQSVTVTASYSGVSQTGLLAVVPAVPLTGLTCSLPAVSGTQLMASSSTAACTVLIAAASTASETFALSSSVAALSVPASVTIPAGATSATFTATAGTISASSVAVTLTAHGYGSTQTLGFKVAVLVSSVTCSPSAIAYPLSTSTTCTVRLSQTVSSSTSVAVSSSLPRLAVPGSVTVPSGSSSANFNGTIGNVDYALITVTATLSGLSQTFTESIGIVPISSLSCSPTRLVVGTIGTCTVTIIGPAPAGGETVTLLTTGITHLTVPASVGITAGSTSATFTIVALTGYTGPVVITAKTGPVSVTTTISSAVVRPGEGLSPRPGQGGLSPTPMTSLPHRLSCTPKLAQAGSTVTCELQFTALAAGGTPELALSVSDSSIHLPARVQGRPGQSTLSFQASVDPAASTQTVSIQATGTDSLAEEHLSVQASGNPVLTVPGKQFATLGSKLSFQVGSVSGSGMVTLSARSLPSGAHFDSSTGVFEWTPNIPGKWRVEFSATDATLAAARAEVAIETGDGSPVLENLRNAASGSSESVCSAGSLATVRGRWLTQGTSESRVFVNGASVLVVYASPTQISFACPSAQVGTTLAVAVETSIGRSATLTTVMRDSALGIFTVDGSGSGQAAASILDGARIAMPRNARYEGQPAQPGDVLQIAVTGLPSETDPSLLTVLFGDVGVPASWVRPVAGSPGITKVGVTLPAATPVGDSVPLTIQQQLSDGRVVTSQTVLVATESLRQ